MNGTVKSFKNEPCEIIDEMKRAEIFAKSKDNVVNRKGEIVGQDGNIDFYRSLNDAKGRLTFLREAYEGQALLNAMTTEEERTMLRTDKEGLTIEHMTLVKRLGDYYAGKDESWLKALRKIFDLKKANYKSVGELRDTLVGSVLGKAFGMEWKVVCEGDNHKNRRGKPNPNYQNGRTYNLNMKEWIEFNERYKPTKFVLERQMVNMRDFAFDMVEFRDEFGDNCYDAVEDTANYDDESYEGNVRVVGDRVCVREGDRLCVLEDSISEIEAKLLADVKASKQRKLLAKLKKKRAKPQLEGQTYIVDYV